MAEPPPAPSSIAETASARERLDAAATLLAEGKVVKARALLSGLTSQSALPQLSDTERTRALAMAANANKRVKSLSAIDVALQSAEVGLESNDLLTAQARLRTVIDSPKATNEETAQARTWLEQIELRQAELLPTADSTLSQAIADFEAGQVEAARTGLDWLKRSGVRLSDERMALAEIYQARVMDAEQIASGASSPQVALGMLQPGVVKRKPEPAQDQAQPPQPEPEPAQDQPAAPPPAEPSATPTDPPADAAALARKWEAQQLIFEADAAFAENRLGEAAARYNSLLQNYADQLTPEQRAEVEKRLAETRVRLGGNPGAAQDVLQQTIADRNAARQAAEAEFNNDLEQARRALAGDDITRARDLAAQARVRTSSARNYFTNEELEAFDVRVRELMTQIDQRDEAIRTERIRIQEKANFDAGQDAAREQAKDKARRIDEAIGRVRALQHELKYTEALQVVESQILFLDPTNPTGLLLRDVLTDAAIYREYYRTRSDNADSYAHLELQNEKALFAPGEIIDYPKDWPAISDRRGVPQAFAESEDNRRALALLQTKRIPVNFNDTPLESVMGFINAVTQLNVDADWASLEAVGIDRQTPVTLNLTNVPVETVLNRVVEKVSPDQLTGAAWSITDGVLTFASKDLINRTKELVIYDIRDLIVEVPDYTNAPTFNLQQALQFQGRGGGGGQNPFQEENEDTERRPLQDRVNEVLQIITTNVDSPGWQENGGDTGYIQQLGGLLIITNTPANHRRIAGLLSKLREYRALQVNVETRFLLVSQDFFEQVGFDLDVYFNADNNQVRAAQASGRPMTRASDFFDMRSDGQAPFRGSQSVSTPILPSQFPLTGGTANAIPPRSTVQPDGWSPIGVGQASLAMVESITSSDFANDILAISPAMGIAGQFLDDIQVDFLIKATQADRRTVTLNAPRLTFTNGQIANIFVGTQVGYVADLTPVTSESAVGFDPQPGAVVDGVSMQLDGTVSADRRYVTLNVETGTSRLEGFNNVPVSAVAGGQLVNSASVQSFIQLPSTTATTINTTVTVPDQGTLLIGGQRLTTEIETESGVPVLSKIPIVNRLFSNRISVKEDQTLLVLIKPTILIQNEEENRHFPGLEDSMRMPFGG